MNRISSGKSGNATGARLRPVVAWLLLASLVLGCQASAQEQSAAPERKTAVLKLHKFSFSYRSRIAPLSCSDLERRVASVLAALGARGDVEVNAIDCDPVASMQMDEPLDARMTRSDPWQSGTDRWGGPTDRWDTTTDRWPTPSDRLRGGYARREQSTHVRVSAMLPIEVTPEVLEEIRKDKTRRELVSRVTGNPAAALNDPILFPAQLQQVTLSNRTLKLEPKECELLEQMATGVFRQLHMRVVRGASCDRNQIAHNPPQAVVETLMPIFEKSPAIGGSEPDPAAPAAPEAPPTEPATEAPPK